MNKNDAYTKPLLPNDIEVRVDSISDKTFTVVCYVNPRTAMYYLDSAFGEGNWSKKVAVDKRSQDTPIFAVCSIEARLDDGTVVVREDVGQDEDSPVNAVSHSIKRAAMNFFPPLRALYTIPTLRIYPNKLGLGEITGKENIKKAIRFKKFYCHSIAFGEGETGLFVSAIQIAEEETGDIVCEFTSKRKTLSRGDSAKVLELKQKMVEASVSEEDLVNRYRAAFRVTSLSEIANTDNLFESAIKFLETKKEKAPAKKPTSTKKTVNDQLKGKKEA